MVTFFTSWSYSLNSTSLCHQSCYVVLIQCDLTVLISLKSSAQNSLPPCGTYCTLHWAYIIQSKIKHFILLLHFFLKQVQYMRSGSYKLLSELRWLQEAQLDPYGWLQRIFTWDTELPLREPSFQPSCWLTVFCVQTVQLTLCGKREEDPKRLHFNRSGIRWQLASAWLRSLGLGPPRLFSLLLSPCKRKEELSHSAPQELRPG